MSRFSFSFSNAIRRTTPVIALFGAAACASDITAPAPQVGKSGKPVPVVVTPMPAFLFVSNQSGAPQIYRFRSDTVTRLSFSDMPDVNPHVSQGRAAFASYRDGDGEIYMGDAQLVTVKRLTFSAGADDEPSLNPAANRIAFVSARSGTSRIYLMDTTGANQVALATGSALSAPETRPAWNRAGDKIAFSSSRTGTAQIFIVPAAGGPAIQLTQESVGAFDPTFSADGSQIIYTAWLASAQLRVITLATGVISTYGVASAQSTGEPSCATDGCLATENPYGTTGNIVHVSPTGTRRLLVSGLANEYRAARLVQ